MKDYLNCKNINTAIRRAKIILTSRVCKGGLYENLGSKEIREIHDKFINLSDYSDDMNNNRAALESFVRWCGNYY